MLFLFHFICFRRFYFRKRLCVREQRIHVYRQEEFNDQPRNVCTAGPYDEQPFQTIVWIDLVFFHMCGVYSERGRDCSKYPNSFLCVEPTITSVLLTIYMTCICMGCFA